MSLQGTEGKKSVRLEETYEGLTSKKLQKEFLQVKLILIQTSKLNLLLRSLQSTALRSLT